MLSGSVLLGIGLIAASRATTLLEFQLLFGVLIGIAIGSYYAPMMAAATAWLDHRRNLAAALVSAGMGVGSMTISPLAGWLLTSLDWRAAMLTIGTGAWALLIPASLLVRPPPAPHGTDAATSVQSDAGDYPLTSWQAFRTPQFAAIALTHFACCAAHSGPLFHMVSYDGTLADLSFSRRQCAAFGAADDGSAAVCGGYAERNRRAACPAAASRSQGRFAFCSRSQYDNCT